MGLAGLTGSERATVTRSTLHAFWDFGGMVPTSGRMIYLDAGAYPIARWGVDRAACRGVPCRTFPHHDSHGLARMVERDTRPGLRPIVVSDGWCAGCGATPVSEYLDIARCHRGHLVLDDTQALGVLGCSPGPSHPYGRGGGGSLRLNWRGGPGVILIASMAKGFGVPLAFVGGEGHAVDRFEAGSETRVHSSPPSFADLHAASRALILNATRGDARRRRLAGLVAHFREGLSALGLKTTGGLFPIQTLDDMSGRKAEAVHRLLLELGVKTVLLRPACRAEPVVTFLITAHHSPAAIDAAVRALDRAVCQIPRRRPDDLTR
jgi:8-amino-7-oxononanoate synthase